MLQHKNMCQTINLLCLIYHVYAQTIIVRDFQRNIILFEIMFISYNKIFFYCRHI